MTSSIVRRSLVQLVPSIAALAVLLIRWPSAGFASAFDLAFYRIFVLGVALLLSIHLFLELKRHGWSARRMENLDEMEVAINVRASAAAFYTNYAYFATALLGASIYSEYSGLDSIALAAINHILLGAVWVLVATRGLATLFYYFRGPDNAGG